MPTLGFHRPAPARSRPSRRLPLDARLLPFLLVLFFFARTTPSLSGEAEPYPSLMMPSFSGNGGPTALMSRLVRTEIVVEFADGTRVPLTTSELFGDMPPSHHGTLMEAFRPAVVTRPWLMPSAAMLPGERLRDARHAVGGRMLRTPETLAWLRARVASAAGRDDVIRLHVRWIEEQRDRSTGAVLVWYPRGTHMEDLRP